MATKCHNGAKLPGEAGVGLQLPHPPFLPRLPKGKPRRYLMLSHADRKEEAGLDEHHSSPSQPEGRWLQPFASRAKGQLPRTGKLLPAPQKKKQHKPLWENHVGSEEAQSCTASGTPDSQRDSLRCLNNQEHEGTHTHTDSQSLSSVFSPFSLKTSYRAEKLWYWLITILHQQHTGKLLSDWCVG